MQRLIARFLLVFTLVGTFVPLALAATATPPHACCIRKAHHCHDSASPESTQLVVAAKSCCNHDCCRAVTTSQWAHAQPLTAGTLAPDIRALVAQSHPGTPAADPFRSQSTRAPPAC